MPGSQVRRTLPLAAEQADLLASGGGGGALIKMTQKFKTRLAEAINPVGNHRIGVPEGSEQGFRVGHPSPPSRCAPPLAASPDIIRLP